MADPFEVRMRFTNQLVHLNASTTSAMKAANYALKYAEFSDDLFSCILEQLERTNMNLRANIMYFLPSLCDSSLAQGESAYIRMLKRDIQRIIDLVAPDNGSGAANVKAVRRVLEQLRQKEFLEASRVAELEDYVSSRDTAPASPHRDPPPLEADATGVSAVAKSTPRSGGKETGIHSAIRLDKRQVEQRIEEDRERHKRAREGIWAVAQKNKASVSEDGELDKLWADALDMVEDDRVLAREETEERRRCVTFEDI